MSNPTTTAAAIAEPAGPTPFDLLVLPVLQFMGHLFVGLWDALAAAFAWEVDLVLFRTSPVALVVVLAVGWSMWADSRRDVLTSTPDNVDHKPY